MVDSECGYSCVESLVPAHLKGPDLSESQISELDLVLNDFPAVLVDRPSNTSAYHVIRVISDTPTLVPISYTLPAC